MCTPRLDLGLQGGKPLGKEQLAHIEYEAAVNRPTQLTVTLEGDSLETPHWPPGSDKSPLGGESTFKLTPDGQTTPVTLLKGLLSERRFLIENGRLQLKLTYHCKTIKAGEGVLGYVDKAHKQDGAALKEALQKAGVTLANPGFASLQRNQQALPPVTPWLLARHRAAANGCVLVSQLDGLHLIKPFSGGAKRKLKLGIDRVVSLELGADASRLIPGAQALAWSIKEQKPLSAQAKQAETNVAADAKKLDRKALKWTLAAPVSKEECEAEAGARALMARLARNQGFVELEGYFEAKVGDTLTVEKGVSSLAGPFWISGVRIAYDRSSCRTTLTLGLAPEDFLPPEPLPDAPLMVGKIAAYKEDPDGLQRLPVKLQGLTDPDNQVWARYATPQAGKERGLFLPPQVDDEVIVGFLGGRWEHPVILGAVHNPKQKPPFPYGQKMPQHALVVEKDKLLWLLNEKDKLLHLSADDKTSLDLSVKQGAQLVQDKDKAVLKKGLLLDSQDLKLKSKKVAIKSDGNVDIKVGGSVNIS